MTKDTTIAILGNGMLGQAVAKLSQELDIPCQVYKRPDWDITRQADIEAVCKKHRKIINCCAYTNVDGAESDRDNAFAVNADGVADLAAAAAASDCYLIHISTDFVFDGQLDRPYTEDDSCKPLNVYGASKRAGEEALLDSAARHSLIRVQWIYGDGGKNFITKILLLATSRESISVVDDQMGSPTWTMDLAGALLHLSRTEQEGLYHYAAKGSASRYEVAKHIAAIKNLDCEISPCDSSAFPAPAQRPLNSRFDCSKFDEEIGISRPAWRDSLTMYLEHS